MPTVVRPTHQGSGRSGRLAQLASGYGDWLCAINDKGVPNGLGIVAICVALAFCACVIAWPAVAAVRQTGSWSGEFVRPLRNGGVESWPVKPVVLSASAVAAVSALWLVATVICWRLPPIPAQHAKVRTPGEPYELG